MENGISISGVRKEQEVFQLAVSSGRTRSQKKEQAEKADQENRKNIYLGDITQGDSQQEVSEKYAMAQKRAIQTILDQLEEDVKIDDDMAGEMDNVEQLQQDIQGYRDGIKAVQERRNDIQGRYYDDSEKSMHQADLLLCDQEEQQYRYQIEMAQRKIDESKATVYATEKALLKTHPMVDAMKESDKIMEAANKEMIGSLFDEGVDEIEEKNAETQKEMAENKEKALEEKIKREKMEAEEKKREESEQEMEDSIMAVTMQAMTYGQQTSDAVQANIKNLIQDQILLDVDLKGLRVDDQV